jgi:hypothetical protein
MSKPTQLAAWKALEAHYPRVAPLHVRDLFRQDPKRFDKFSAQFQDILLDYSKNRITEETFQLLLDLAREADLKGWTEKMFTGQKINITENRAVLHIALRNRSNRPILVDGKDVMPEVNAVLAHMREFSEAIRSGAWKGYTGKAITDVVNRRLRPWPGHGHRGAEALQQAQPARPLRLQRGRHPDRGNAQDPQPGDDAVPHRLQDIHHTGDDDQRPQRPRLVPEECEG